MAGLKVLAKTSHKNSIGADTFRLKLKPATIMVTPTKITDYFPPSPKPDECDENDHGKESKVSDPNADDQKSDSNPLSDSSVLITPNPSPHKEEVVTPDKIEKTEPEQKSDENCKERKCKKSLPIETVTKKTTENEAAQSITKSKRKGRRKKREPKPESQNSPVVNGPAKPKSARKKQKDGSEIKNTLLTDFFPVRRSDRKSKNEIEKEKIESLHYKILNSVEDGLKVQEMENKGRGVVATKAFKKGDFVVEYAGDLIDMKEAHQRDEDYAKDPSKGCYMYYFNFQNKKYCIDATAESGKLGRLLNHSKTSGNCTTKLVGIKDHPYLILVAMRDIDIGEELLYDYGDRSKASLESHPWLKS